MFMKSSIFMMIHEYFNEKCQLLLGIYEGCHKTHNLCESERNDTVTFEVYLKP